MNEPLIDDIRAAIQRGDYRFTEHGLQEATADDFSVTDVRDAIMSERAEIIEDYPSDSRGASCLILAWTAGGRALHAVVSYPPDIAIITVYEPSSEKWEELKTRRR